MAEDKFQTAGGVKLHYLDFGGVGKPALVCIHGLTGNAHNFDALVPHLSARYHVLAVDVRGRGDSGWGPPMDYNPQVYVSDLKEFLDALGIKRVSLVGTSMGGVISMMYAGGYPETVERLVLNDIGPEIDPTGLLRIMAYVGQAPERFKDMAEVRAYYRATYPPAVKLSDAESDRVGTMVGQTNGGRRAYMEDGPGGSPSAARRLGSAADRFVAALQSSDGADPDSARRRKRHPVTRHRGPDGQGAARRATGRGSRSRSRPLAGRAGGARGDHELPRHYCSITLGNRCKERLQRTYPPDCNELPRWG